MSSSLKSIKYEYQHCISNTNGSIFIEISIFWGAPFIKALRAVRKWVRFQKNFGSPIISDMSILSKYYFQKLKTIDSFRVENYSSSFSRRAVMLLGIVSLDTIYFRGSPLFHPQFFNFLMDGF